MYDEKAIESISLKHFQSLIDAADKPREKIAREVGMDASTITKYYNGDRHLSVSAIRKFANYFNVSGDYLLGLSETKTNDKNLQDVCRYIGLKEETVLQLIQLYSKTVPVSNENSIYWVKISDLLDDLIQNVSLVVAFDNILNLCSSIQPLVNQMKNLITQYYDVQTYEEFYSVYEQKMCFEQDSLDKVDFRLYLINKEINTIFEELYRPYMRDYDKYKKTLNSISYAMFKKYALKQITDQEEKHS